MTGSNDPPEYLTVNEAAAYAGVTRHKIARLIRAGTLSTFESDLDRRKRFIRREDLDRLRTTFRPQGDDQ